MPSNGEAAKIELHESIGARWRASPRVLLRAVSKSAIRWVLIIAALQVVYAMFWQGPEVVEIVYVAVLGGVFMGFGKLFFNRSLVMSQDGIRIIYDDINEDLTWSEVSQLTCETDGRLLRVTLRFKQHRPPLVLAVNDTSAEIATETKQRVQRYVESHNETMPLPRDSGCAHHASP